MNKFQVLEKVIPAKEVNRDFDYGDYYEWLQNFINDPDNEHTMDEIASFNTITYDDVKDYVNWVWDEWEMSHHSEMYRLGLSWRDFY